jgi:hypothetical protein
MPLRRVLFRSLAALGAASALSFVGMSVAGATGPNSGDQVPGAAAAVVPFTAHTPFTSGQNINVVVPANSVFNSTSGLNVVECTTDGVHVPSDPASCDGNTINGPSLFANADGSVNYKTFTGSFFPVYALPDSISLGENPGGPACSITVQCVLYIGTNQNDFTQPHVWSQFFYVRANADDKGGSPGDGSPAPPATTTVVVPTPASPSVFGQSVGFTATVTPVSPATGTPTGTVTVSDGATTLGTVGLVSGSATFSTSALAVGSHSITAVYSSDSNFAGSTSTALPYTVGQAATTTSVSALPVSPSVFGQSVAFTATVAASPPGSGTPTGTVTLSDGATTLGAGSLSGGTFTFSTSALSVGTHTISAVYGGDSSFTGSSTSSSLTFVVNQSATSSALVSSANPSASNASVTFTDTVLPVAPGAGTATGTVTFFDGATQIGTPQTLNGSAVASLSTSTLSVGAHSITAVYGGDSSFAGSTSNIVTQTVSHYSSTTTLSSDVNPSKTGVSVTFTATVAPVAPGTGTVTGSVAFREGSTLLGTTALNGAGVATFSTAALAAGSHSITAVYGGDGNFATSTSAILTQVVLPTGGYWLGAGDGGIFAFGSAPFYGSTGGLHLNQPIVGMAATPDGHGYWLVAKDGGIFTFGNAHFYGSVPQIAHLNGIVGMVADMATGGYWVINSDGTIFNFNAPQDGTLPFFGFHVHNIVGGAATPDGRGLYLVGADGSVYTMLGTATHQGTLAGHPLNAPIIGMAIDPATGGYWLLGADGGLFTFNAPYYGSTGGLHMNKPVVGMAPTADGGGYWFVAADGGVFTFGNAPYKGSTGSLSLNQPVIGMAAAS